MPHVKKKKKKEKVKQEKEKQGLILRECAEQMYSDIQNRKLDPVWKN